MRKSPVSSPRWASGAGDPQEAAEALVGRRPGGRTATGTGASFRWLPTALRVQRQVAVSASRAASALMGRSAALGLAAAAAAAPAAGWASVPAPAPGAARKAAISVPSVTSEAGGGVMTGGDDVLAHVQLVRPRALLALPLAVAAAPPPAPRRPNMRTRHDGSESVRSRATTFRAAASKLGGGARQIGRTLSASRWAVASMRVATLSSSMQSSMPRRTCGTT
jgi:hypothetical protein